MGFFDQLKNLGKSVPGVSEGMGVLDSATQAVNPPELANMEQQVGVIKQKLAEAQKGLTENTMQATELVDLRISLMGHYIHLQEGGDPKPEELTAARIRVMPQFLAMKSEYPSLNQSLAALESQYSQCTYGYQMADGSVLVPDITWSADQWQQVRDQSVDKTARCWANTDKSPQP